MSSVALHARGRTIPIVLPNVRDPRLHAAGVVMTIHVLGQTAFGFAVSVPQLVAAIGTAALLGIAITLGRERRLVWPASAMLTGSGIGLILRVEGTMPGDHWTTHRWYLYSIVAAASVASRHALRWRGRQVFNPSNVGLVTTFLILGSSRVEPLDLWWHPIGPAMGLAYAIILGGGLAITYRLELLGLAIAFWTTLMAGLGVLASTGQCLAVSWSARPACDAHVWWIFATSPEVLIFVFFMITDPRTVPAGRVNRLAFGTVVGLLASVLIAPQPTEFRAKVALLGALTIATALRPFAGVARATARRLDAIAIRASQRWGVAASDLRGIVVGLTVPVAAIAIVGALMVLGSPATQPVAAPLAASDLPLPEQILPWQPPVVLPAVTASPDVEVFGPRWSTAAGQREVVIGLLRALATEAEILRRRDTALLRAVDHGRRLTDMTEQIAAAGDGPILVPEHRIDTCRLVPLKLGGQSGAVLGVEATGTVRLVSYIDGRAVSERTEPITVVAGLRQATDGRWMIVDVR